MISMQGIENEQVLVIELESSLLLFLLNLLLLSLFLYRLRKYHRDAPWFLATLVFMTIGTLLSFLDSPLLFTGTLLSEDTTFFVHLLIYQAAFSFFYMHMELSSNVRPNIIRLAFVGILTAILIFSGGIIVWFNYRIAITFFSSNPPARLVNIISSRYKTVKFLMISAHYLTTILAFLVGARVHWMTSQGRDIKDTISTVTQTLLAFSMIGLFSSDLLFYLFLIDEHLKTILYTLFMLLVAIIFTVYTTMYAFHPPYLYRMPIKVFSMFVQTTGGLPYMQVDFETKNHEDFKIDPLLFSGLISAADAISSAIFYDKLQEIHTASYKILILQGKNTVITLITNGMSHMLLAAIKRFREIFEKNMHRLIVPDESSIKNHDSHVKALQDSLETIFPFLKIKNIKYQIEFESNAGDKDKKLKNLFLV